MACVCDHFLPQHPGMWAIVCPCFCTYLPGSVCFFHLPVLNIPWAKRVYYCRTVKKRRIAIAWHGCMTWYKTLARTISFVGRRYTKRCYGDPRWKTCVLRQISLAWRNVKNNRRTIGLLSLDNWRGVNLWRNKNELSTLDGDPASLWTGLVCILKPVHRRPPRCEITR